MVDEEAGVIVYGEDVPARPRNSKALYRVTMICTRVGGAVTAENVGLKFKCPSCGTRATVDLSDMSLVCDGHTLRKVVEL